MSKNNIDGYDFHEAYHRLSGKEKELIDVMYGISVRKNLNPRRSAWARMSSEEYQKYFNGDISGIKQFRSNATKAWNRLHKIAKLTKTL